MLSRLYFQQEKDFGAMAAALCSHSRRHLSGRLFLNTHQGKCIYCPGCFTCSSGSKKSSKSCGYAAEKECIKRTL